MGKFNDYINITAPLHSATTKGKLGNANEIFLEGDTQNIENEIKEINSRHEELNKKHDTLSSKHESLSKTVQGIAATGGASTANNVTYNNDSSGLNSENVQDAIDEVSSTAIYDVSARNNGVVFESLQALLSSSNLNTLIPVLVRHGGMTIRFIQGSEQKYAQYRYISNSVTETNFTNIGNWQNDDNGFKTNIIISSLTSNKNLYTGIEDNVKKFINPDNGKITNTIYDIRVSKPIFISGLSYITLQKSGTAFINTTGYRFLDADLNIISYAAFTKEVTHITVQVPSGAVFFQMSIDDYASSTYIQVEAGQAETEYVEHKQIYTDELRKYFFNALYESYTFPNGHSVKIALSTNRNIYNGDRLPYYYIENTDGSIAKTTYDFFVSTLIPVSSKMKSLVVSRSTVFDVNGKYHFLDKTKTFISGSGGAFTSSLKAQRIDIPENAAYFQFSMSTISSNIQVEYGIKETEYIAFSEATSITDYLATYYDSYILQLAVTKSELFGNYTLVDIPLNHHIAKGKNLWDGIKKEGYYIDENGKVVTTPYANWFVSSEIQIVTFSEKLIVSNSDSTAFAPQAYGRFLDKNHNFITGSVQLIRNFVNIPENAVYFQFSCDSTTDIQVEYGSIATEYEAFTEGTIFEYFKNFSSYIDNKQLIEIIPFNWSKSGYFRRSIMNFENHNNYSYSDFIKVKAGDIVESKSNYDNIYVTGIQFFNTKKIPIIDSQTGKIKIAPENGYVVISYENGGTDWCGKIYRTIAKDSILENSNLLKNRSEARLRIKKDASLANVNSNISIIGTPSVKNWYQVSAYFKIPNGMSRVKLSKGENNYCCGRVEIDDTNVYTYDTLWSDENQRNEVQLASTIPHGLTMADFVIMRVYVSAVFKQAKLTIMTNASAPFETVIPWNGCAGDPLLVNLGTNGITDAELAFDGTCFSKDVWFFADSYSDFWPEYMYNKGYNNFLIDGQSGRTAGGALVSLKRALLFGIPKTIVWAMGMNNQDTAPNQEQEIEGGVNADYASSFDELCNICYENNIELRPCTIPNTPTILHTYKNDLIHSTFFDYIDIAKCLGADEAGSHWFTGLLGNDNVHPTSKGSKVVAESFLNSVGRIRLHNSTE